MHNFTQNVSGHYETPEYVFFWGGPFSNWFKSKFVIDGVQYNCAEQYLMAEKARAFADEEAVTNIMKTSDPRKQKQFGRAVKNYDEAKWIEVREDIMTKGLVAKFSQNSDLRKILLDTNKKTVAESSPVDSVWGIGMHVDNPDVLDPTKWNGLNILGKCLMIARDFIINQQVADIEGSPVSE